MGTSLVVLSGGLDSTVLLHERLAMGLGVRAISFDYGQRHRKEMEAAAARCAALRVPHDLVDLTALTRFLKGSSQTDPAVPVPHGHYAAETMKATIVPNRNMIMLSAAVGVALGMGCEVVAYAAHAGDHAIYPDCRPEFVAALAAAVKLCDWRPVQLVAPFVHLTKADIVRKGEQLRVPFAETWSCYEGGELHCGRCGTCVERREAFELAGVADPTIYVGQEPTA